MIKYIHIGYPKAASTSLQAHYFSKLPEVLHLGCSGGGTVAPYIDDEMRVCIEVELRLSKDFVYRKGYVERIFERYFEFAEIENYRCVGMSSESLAFTMHHDIDVTQKASRLHSIFGSETKIIMIIRDQQALLKSLYKEYVISGVYLSYWEFINAIYANRFRSLLHDLEYMKMYDLYSSLFGHENVFVIPFEALVHDPNSFVRRLDRALALDSKLNSIPRENGSIDDGMIEFMRMRNQTLRHNAGKSVLEPVNNFRYRDWYKDDSTIVLDASMEESVLNGNYADAESHMLNGYSKKIDFSCDKSVYEKILNIYSSGNSTLSSKLDLNLKELGYVT